MPVSYWAIGPMLCFDLQLLTCRVLSCHFLTDSVDDIIDHYKKEQIVEGYNLKEPVSVQVSVTVYWHYWVCLIIFDQIFFFFFFSSL